jgi:hypothetical protein
LDKLLEDTHLQGSGTACKRKGFGGAGVGPAADSGRRTTVSRDFATLGQLEHETVEWEMPEKKVNGDSSRIGMARKCLIKKPRIPNNRDA